MLTGGRLDTSDVQKVIGNIDASLDAWNSAFNEVGGSLKKFYGTMPFTSQGGVYKKRWARLDTTYASRKAKKFPGKNILVASGRMSRGFQFQSSSKQVTITNKDPNFKFHQLGTSKMPQRVMMLIDKQRKEAIAKTMGESLQKKVSKA